MNKHDRDGLAGPSALEHKPANIHDVARHANVSTKTVSKVVNNMPNVSSATRQRVMEAVSALSYRPNLVARSLVSKRSFMLGLLCDSPAAGSGYIARLQMGILQMCQKEGYHLVVETLDAHNPNLEERVHSLVVESRLIGVILTPPLCDLQNLIDALRASHTPMVRISPRKPVPNQFDVSIDNHKAAYDMTAYLISLGHTRIGFIKGAPEHPDSAMRFDGYRAALADAGLPYEEEICAQGHYTYKSGMEAADRLLVLSNRPTAIFASNDDMAAGVMAASLRFDIKIPRDLSVTGFDDALFAHAVWPRLTTCRQPIEDMAETAVSMLIKQHSDIGPFDNYLKHTIIVRGTTAPPAS